MLRCLTAGESHGKGILAILEGMPAGLGVNIALIDKELKRRQQGFGRGKRMQIEKDKAQILSGLKNNRTLGSPVTFLIQNKDFSIEKLARVISPRPGHADLAGLLKYGFSDIREVLERASARNTAANVAVGALCKIFLAEFGVKITSRVLSIGGRAGDSGMEGQIKQAIKNMDTVGGIFEITATDLPPGLGSYAHADRRLDGRLAGVLMSIPGIKAVEVGLGLGYAVSFGSEVHDPIYFSKGKGYFRSSNNAGGIEGGITNGENIILRCCMKPIATLMRPLESVNIISRRPSKAAVERSDTCVVQSAGVVAESQVAYVLTDAFLEKFGADSLLDIKKAYLSYIKRIR